MAEAIISRRGGGGGGLNFQVVGGTTAPSNPKENMIWINTSTAITDWVFSATQPTAASGRVWITTGTSSTVAFNALKKNGIQVYPISAKQYISGAWVDKTAKSYQNGQWVDWIPENALFWLGYDKTEVTGGWMKTYHNQGSGGTFAMNGDSITLKAGSGTAAAQCGCMTQKSINLTGKNTLKVNVTAYSGTPSGNNMGQIMVFSSKGAPFNASAIIAEAYITKNKTGVFSLSVSTVGSAYIAVLAYDNGCSFTIDKVWLE